MSGWFLVFFLQKKGAEVAGGIMALFFFFDRGGFFVCKGWVEK